MDTYSFAILLAFLFTEQPPYHQLRNNQIFIQVRTRGISQHATRLIAHRLTVLFPFVAQVCQHKLRPPLVGDNMLAEPLPPLLVDLVQRMWAHVGADRPPLSDVLSSLKDMSA